MQEYGVMSDMLGADGRLLLRQVPRPGEGQQRPDWPRPPQGDRAGGDGRRSRYGRCLARHTLATTWVCIRYRSREADVWVEFEAGDPSYPIWVGCFWADGQAPKNERGDDATPPLKIIRSQKGLMVTLDDKEQVITVSDKDGNNLITIEVQQGKVTVKGTLKVVVEAPQIELVENSTHPVVFGDKLLRVPHSARGGLSMHAHPPTPTTPPVVVPAYCRLQLRT